MEEKDLIKKFSNFRPSPSREWQEETLEHLNNVVTDSLDNRNSNTNLNNFLNSFTMNTKFKAIVSIATVAATLAITTGVVYASNSAMPGDPLYGLDKATEQIRRALTINPLEKAGFEMEVMDERVLELQKRSEEEGSSSDIAKCLSEVEAQQLRLRERLEEMTQLRSRNRVQAEEQLQLMNKLASKIQNNEEVLAAVQSRLEQKGSEAGELKRIRDSYSEEMGSQIQNFEENTGLKINTQTAEQNQGEDSQIRNQVQVETKEGEPAQDVQGAQEMNKGEENGNR